MVADGGAPVGQICGRGGACSATDWAGPVLHAFVGGGELGAGEDDLDRRRRRRVVGGESLERDARSGLYWYTMASYKGVRMY